MVSAFAKLAEGGAPPICAIKDDLPEAELPPVTGRVQWFDATRGFGFLVSDELDGDVLLHFSVLREHGRRSVPEGASSNACRSGSERGLQAKRILSIDLSSALPQQPRSSIPAAERADRRALRTRPASSSRWRSMASPRSRLWLRRSGPTNWAARTSSCTWRRSATRILESSSRARRSRRGSLRARRG